MQAAGEGAARGQLEESVTVTSVLRSSRDPETSPSDVSLGSECVMRFSCCCRLTFRIVFGLEQ